MFPKEIGKKKLKESVSLFSLFRYSNRYDKFLMIFGSISALISAATFPVIFIMYGRIADVFVNWSRLHKLNVLRNETLSNECSFEIKSMDYDRNLRESVLYDLFAGIVSIIFCYSSNYCWNLAAERQIKRLRNKTFHSILRQECEYFDRNSPSELNSILIKNISTIQQAIGFRFSDSLMMFGRFLANFVTALVISGKFAAIFLTIFPLVTICDTIRVRLLKKCIAKENRLLNRAKSIADEVLGCMKTVHAFCLQEKKLIEYEERLDDVHRESKKKGFYNGLLSGLMQFLNTIVFAIAMYYGIKLAQVDCTFKMSPGRIVLATSSLFHATFSLNQALPFLNDLAEAQAAAFGVFHVIEKKSKIDVFDDVNNPPHNDNPLELDGNIKFENVHFSYPTRQDAKILRGLTFEIEKGKTIALCGSSGGGKSTVIQLLQRYYEPLDGKILINNREIQNININKLRSQMALVSQEPILFATSIKENIRLGRLNASDVEIEEAAKLANAHDFILKLNDKYDTLVGERGSQLSGGQKQRIAIARALIRQPKILLLDEATSALDLQSERVVQDALDRAKIGRTTIIVAHRLSTIRNADLIIALNNGQVAEMGTHDELMSHGGIYYDLVMKQTKEHEMSPIVEESLDSENECDAKISFETPNIPHQTYSSDSETEISKASIKKRRLKRPFKYEKWLWKYHASDKWLVIVGSICQVARSMEMPLFSLLFSRIYQIFLISDFKQQTQSSIVYMCSLFGVSVLAFTSIFGSDYISGIVASRVTKRLRIKMFESMLRQEIAWYDEQDSRPSVLSTRLTMSAPLAKSLTTEKLFLILYALTGVGFATILSLTLNWKFALVMMCFIPVNIFSGLIRTRSTLNTMIKGKNIIEEASMVSSESIDHIKTVMSLGREKYFYDKFENIFDARRSFAILHLQAFGYAISCSFIFFIQATAFSYGYSLMKQGLIEAQNVFGIFFMISISSILLGTVFSSMPDKRKTKQAARALYKILNRKPEIDALSEQGLKPNKFNGSIKFDNVHFKYPTRNNKILNGLTLEINANETTALVGESGCGKSTTIQLLLRFYDCTKGSILIDGVNIKDLNIKWLREQIGLVSQEPILFNTTIRKNIEYGDVTNGSIQFDEVVRVSKEANIHFKIENLPQKYDTLVGTKGGQLSGGEKQRVAIARALIRKPKILLLDEATSALDTQSEELVQDALDRAQQGRTCVSIAHRLSTIQNAPKISVFKRGVIAEEGTHAQLMSNKGLYYNLQVKNKSV